MKPKVINLHEAKTHLSRLVDEVAAGAELIIGKAGEPLARLIPFKPATLAARKGGQLAGKIWEAADCWEHDADLEALMSDGPVFPPAPAAKSRVAEMPRRSRGSQ